MISAAFMVIVMPIKNNELEIIRNKIMEAMKARRDHRGTIIMAAGDYLIPFTAAIVNLIAK